MMPWQSDICLCCLCLGMRSSCGASLVACEFVSSDERPKNVTWVPASMGQG